MIQIPERWLGRWRSTLQARTYLWKIERRDGTVLRFTSWDTPLWLLSEKFIPRDEDDSGDFDERGGGQFGGETRQASLKEHSAALQGILSHSSITHEDLRRGLYEDATVYIYLVDALRMSSGYHRRTYRVADVGFSTDGQWRLQLVSAIDAALQQRVGEVVSRTCRNCHFGPRCSSAKTPGGSDGLVADEWETGQTSGNFCVVSSVTNNFEFRVQIPASEIDSINTGSAVPDTTYFRTATNHYLCGENPDPSRQVTSQVRVYGNVGSSPDFNDAYADCITDPVSPDRNLVITGIDVIAAGSTLGFICQAPDEDRFQGGVLTWRSGDNAGDESRVEANTVFVPSPVSGYGGYVDVTLSGAPFNDVQVGDTLTLRAGCDQSLEVCEQRFDNVVNFNGEPFTPTADILINTPSVS